MMGRKTKMARAIEEMMCKEIEIRKKYSRAVEVVKAAGSVSIPLLKRELNVNWHDAAKLVELMEAEGVIGPFNGIKPREIRAVES